MIFRNLLFLLSAVLIGTGCGSKGGSAAADSTATTTSNSSLTNCVVGTNSVGNCKIN